MFRKGWLSKYINEQFTFSKENLSNNIKADLLTFLLREKFEKCIKTHFNKGSWKVNWPKRMQFCKRKHHTIVRDCDQLLRSTWQPLLYISIHMQGRSVHQSQDHLNLQNMVSLQTKKLTKNYRNSRKAKSCENLATSKTPREIFMSSKNKPKWLFRLGIEQFIVKNNTQIPIELYDATYMMLQKEE